MQRAVEGIAHAHRESNGAGTTASWATFARDCGYADQAHLIREFRALTGLTPRTYARSRAMRAMSEIDNPAPGAPGSVGP
jgi:AraC-like DNA-binding protein